MTVSLKHKFTSAKADSADTSLIRPSNWNDEHDLTLASGKLLGRTTAGTGAAEEISAGTGLTLSTGTLQVTPNTYQPLDTELTAIAGLASAADTAPYFTGSGSASLMTVTAAGRALLDDANAAAQRATLGLDGTATPTFTGVELGNTTDTTLSRLSAGTLGVEGVEVALNSTAKTHTALNVELGHASDTTISRVSAGTIAVEGNVVPSPTGQTKGDILYRDTATWERLPAGTSGHVLQTNGAGAAPSWVPLVSGSSYTVYTTGSGNWPVPSSGTFALVRVWGAGGSGCSGGGTQKGGGGGGSYKDRLYRLSDLGPAGTLIPYAVGIGGTAVTGASNGNPGGNTTFGSGANLVTAYGGGGGSVGGTVGTGGGYIAAGGSGVSAGFGGPGTGAGADAPYPWSGANGGSSSTTTGGAALFGGAGGGGANGTTSTATAGGSSVFGGNGGAGGNTGGTAGSAPGGGGGACNSGTSGAGANGKIEIYVW